MIYPSLSPFLVIGYWSIAAVATTLQNDVSNLSLTDKAQLAVPNGSGTVDQTNLLSSTNGSSMLSDILPQGFNLKMDQKADTKINGKSTYLVVLQALVRLSQNDFYAPYTGDVFASTVYPDVRIKISMARSRTASFQYRFAIWGLYGAMFMLSDERVWRANNCSLSWSGSGRQVTVGYIEFYAWPPQNGIDGGDPTLGLPDLLTPANVTIMNSNDTSVNSSVAASQITITTSFDGNILTFQEVFLTLYATLVTIAPHRADDDMEPFTATDQITSVELEYRRVTPARVFPPYLTYRVAAMAVELIPRQMFQAAKFEGVIFFVNVDATLVGGGKLGWKGTEPGGAVNVQRR